VCKTKSAKPQPAVLLFLLTPIIFAPALEAVPMLATRDILVQEANVCAHAKLQPAKTPFLLILIASALQRKNALMLATRASPTLEINVLRPLAARLPPNVINPSPQTRIVRAAARSVALLSTRALRFTKAQ